MATVVVNTVLCNRNLLRVKLTCSHTHTQRSIHAVMDVLTRWGQSFHNVYLYQIAMTYTLNILSFYMAIIPNKAEFLKKETDEI